jgi:hypothetical protein
VADPASPAGRAPGRPVPSPQGRLVLTFVFLATLEYWLLPPLLGIDNMAGLWSTVGNLLFAAWVAALVIFVLRPLHPHLLRALERPRAMRNFWAVLLGSTVAALVVTETLRIGGGGWSLAPGTVYTPFGATPSLELAGPMEAALDPVALALAGVLAWLWSAALTLHLDAQYRLRAACALGSDAAKPSVSGAALLASWAPLGWIASCSACLPTYASAVALVFPGAVVAGYAAVPLAPWMGLAGLLYLTSFVLVLTLLRRITDADPRALYREDPA